MIQKRALVLVGILVLSAAISRVDDARGLEPPPKLLGFATNDWPNDLSDFEAEAGKMPALLQVFWTLESTRTSADYVSLFEGYADAGVTAYVELTTDDLAATLAGDRDVALQTLIDAVVTWSGGGSGRYVIMAPFPEANLDHHPWGGDAAAYRAAYNKVRDAFLASGLAGDRVRWVFAMNGLSSTGLSYSQFYPGDDVVDILGFSKRNRGGIGWRDYEETFERHIIEMQARDRLHETDTHYSDRDRR